MGSLVPEDLNEIINNDVASWSINHDGLKSILDAMRRNVVLLIQIKKVRGKDELELAQGIKEVLDLMVEGIEYSKSLLVLSDSTVIVEACIANYKRMASGIREDLKEITHNVGVATGSHTVPCDICDTIPGYK
jgi:hypothetical protein